MPGTDAGTAPCPAPSKRVRVKVNASSAAVSRRRRGAWRGRPVVSRPAGGTRPRQRLQHAAPLVGGQRLQAVRQGLVLLGETQTLLHPAFLASMSTSSILFPAALLTGTVQVASRMHADGEFVAAQSAGVSWHHTARAFLLAGGAATGISLAAAHVVEPPARRSLARYVQNAVGHSFLQGDDAVALPGGGLAEVLSRRDGTRFVVFSRRGQGTDTVVVGVPERLLVDADGGRLSLGLSDVTFLQRNRDGGYQCSRVETVEATTPLRLPGRAGFTALSTPALMERVADRKRRGLPFGRARLELEKRFSLPFACLAFGLLGLPLGCFQSRGDRAYGYLLSAAVILGYYFVVRGADALANPYPVASRLLVWCPNVTALLVGALWLRRREGAGP